jgi:hypothetical protein
MSISVRSPDRYVQLRSGAVVKEKRLIDPEIHGRSFVYFDEIVPARKFLPQKENPAHARFGISGDGRKLVGWS